MGLIMEDLAEFYKGKRVLLTGHTGFKGTWMTLLLNQFNAQICGYSLPVNKDSFYAKVAPTLAESVEADIADYNTVLQTVRTYRPEIIIHFASHSSLKDIDKIPEFILRTNLMGVVNILDAVRLTSGIKSVVIVTSDKCYMVQSSGILYKENSPLGGKEPYSVSKVCQELLTSCYRDTFFQRDGKRTCIATARASNVIGPGDDNQNRLIPYLVNSYMHNEVAKIRKPNFIRPWQYVLDVLTGYLILGKKLYESYNTLSSYSSAYNFGPEEEGFVSVADVAKLLAKHFDDAQWDICESDSSSSLETSILKLDNSKAKKDLQWKNFTSLEDMLSITACFAKQENRGISTRELAVKTILNYLGKEVTGEYTCI